MIIAVSLVVWCRAPTEKQQSKTTVTELSQLDQGKRELPIDLPTFEPGTFVGGVYTNKASGFTFALPSRSTLPLELASSGVIDVTDNLQIVFNDSYKSYESAIQMAKDNLENPQTKSLSGGILYIGKQISGAGGGIVTRYAIFDTSPYPTIISLLYRDLTEIVDFDQIVTSFKFTN